MGISEVQKALGLSSSSVSEYHIGKLLKMGLIKEEGTGYIIDRVVVENVIRIRRVSVPTQAGYAIFFGVSLLFLLIFLRPPSLTSLYFFAMVICASALVIALYEARKTLLRLQ